MTLTRTQQIKYFKIFLDKILRLKIDGTLIFIRATTEHIIINPEISIQELQNEFKIYEDSYIKFIRKLYINNINIVIKEHEMEEKQLPIVSFSGENHIISINI